MKPFAYTHGSDLEMRRSSVSHSPLFKLCRLKQRLYFFWHRSYFGMPRRNHDLLGFFLGWLGQRAGGVFYQRDRALVFHPCRATNLAFC